LNSRERVIRAITFGGPDRVPLLHGVLPAALMKHGQALVDLLYEYKDDFGGQYSVPKPEDITGPYAVGESTDEWGVGWQNDYHGMLGIPVVHPLAEWENWKGYKLPASPDDAWYADMKKRIAESGHEHYINLGGVNLFERMQWIRGYDNLMVDIALDADEAYILRDAIVERELDYLRKAVDVGADGFHFGDDWGTQVSLIISPDTWRKFYKPAYTRMFEVCKSAGKHVHFHSDGFTWTILADLLDAGVDVLNIQHTIMDLGAIARDFGGKAAFRSDLDRQHILPHGTRDQIRAHVKEVFDALGSYNGGLIGHGEMAVDVPLENIRAMLQAWREFGVY
jgi:uroporphyrinogen decarboxylase